MADSKLIKLRSIKSHPLAFHSRKASNKINVTVHPKVVVRKKPEKKVRPSPSTILNIGTPFGVFKTQREQLACRQSNYLEVHFIYANSVGASPYKFDSSIKWQLKVPYLIVNSLAMLDNLLLIWDSIQDATHVNSSSEIAIYVRIAKGMSYVILRVVHAASLWNDADKYANIFTVLDETPHSASATPDLKKTAFAVGVSVFGMIRALSRSLAGVTLGTESFLIGHCGRIVTKFVKVWNEPDNIDFPCGVLGVLGFLATLSGGIIEQAAVTGSLMAATTLLSACKEFKYKETPSGLETGTGNANNGVPPGMQVRKRYGELKQISKAINRALSPTLKLLLLANLFMFASLIDNIFNGELAKGTKAWLLYDAALACLFLYLANAIGNTGERFREWIKDDRNRIQVGMSQLDVIQEETSSQSIGIGRGAFLITDGFLLGYVGAIVAYFFGIVETRPKITTDFESTGFGNQTANLPGDCCNYYCRGN